MAMHAKLIIILLVIIWVVAHKIKLGIISIPLWGLNYHIWSEIAEEKKSGTLSRSKMLSKNICHSA